MPASEKKGRLGSALFHCPLPRLIMLPSHFFANLARMKLIYRWPLMRNIQSENIAEHSLQVAMVAHALGLIKIAFLAARWMRIAPP